MRRQNKPSGLFHGGTREPGDSLRLWKRSEGREAEGRVVPLSIFPGMKLYSQVCCADRLSLVSATSDTHSVFVPLGREVQAQIIRPTNVSFWSGSLGQLLSPAISEEDV